MPLEDLNSIDIISKPNEEGIVTLYITDSGVTTDPDRRYQLLLSKLQGYLGEIVGGGLQDQFPNHSPSQFAIEVICALEPTDQMKAITKIAPQGESDLRIPVRFRLFSETMASGTAGDALD